MSGREVGTVRLSRRYGNEMRRKKQARQGKKSRKKKDVEIAEAKLDI